MSHFFTYAVLTATVATALGLAAPFLLAALGETVGQRSGVINLGVDGIMLLSAFATPIDNMPTWLQPITLVNPLRYFLVIVNGVFLRDLPIGEVVKNSVPLALIAVGTLSAAAWLFRRRLE